MKKKNLSMKEIAELAEVSVATVSRVINQNGRFSRETEQRVRNIIEEYSYKTNLVAKSLRVRRTKSIGVIVPNIKNEFFASIVLEIERYFFEEGYSVFICNTNGEGKKEKEYLKSLDAKGVDGLIYISGKGEMSLSSLQRNLPIVCIDRMPSIDENIAIVESDNYSGGYLATETLIKKGCQNILLIKSKSNVSTIELRAKGYETALKKYGLLPNKNLILDLEKTTFENAKGEINGVLEKGIPFDGIFAMNDWIALGSLISLTENNVKVPEDVKIVGFDNISISKYSYPGITTINQDKKRLGEEASKALLNFINEKNIKNKMHIVLPVSLVARETT
jgi:LacI family transcriptional regulator